MKLLWAPIVDALYIKTIGRRKCWLVPLQFLMGRYIKFVHYNIIFYKSVSISYEFSPHLLQQTAIIVIN